MNNGIVLNSAVFYHINNIVDQERRSHSLNFTGKSLEKLRDLLEADYGPGNGGKGIRGSNLASVASKGMRFNTLTEETSIDGGWRNERFRVFLEFEIAKPRPHVAGKRCIFVGYTDRVNIEYDNRGEPSIEPTTRIYINNIYEIADYLRERRGRKYYESRLVKNYQLLLGEYTDIRSDRNEYTNRPSDVMSSLSLLVDIGGLDDDDNDITYDSDNMFVDGSKTSSRSNNSRGNFMASVINADVTGLSEEMVYGNRRDESALFSQSRNTVAALAARGGDPNVMDNPVMFALFGEDGLREYGADSYFYYEDLVQFCIPNTIRELDEMTQFTESNDDDAGDSERWGASRNEAVGAHSVCYELPDIMTDSLLSCVYCVASNINTRGDEVDFAIKPESLKQCVSGDFGPALQQRFEERFIREIFNTISNDGDRLVEITVDADLNGMIDITICYDGGSEYVYKFSGFADARMPPTVSRDRVLSAKMANGILRLRKDVIDPVMTQRIGRDFDDDDDRDDDRGRGKVTGIFDILGGRR